MVIDRLNGKDKKKGGAITVHDVHSACSITGRAGEIVFVRVDVTFCVKYRFD